MSCGCVYTKQARTRVVEKVGYKNGVCARHYRRVDVCKTSRTEGTEIFLGVFNAFAVLESSTRDCGLSGLSGLRVCTRNRSIRRLLKR